jgi:hypothetical protein
VPGIISFFLLLLALIFNIVRAARGDNASTALVGVVLPVVIGLSVVIIPVVLIVRIGNKRYRRAMVQLKSQYPHVYYAIDFKNGPRILAVDKQTVSIWRARRNGPEQEVSWRRGTVNIKQESVPVSRAVTVPGIVFTDPNNKLRRMAISDRVTVRRIHPVPYNTFLHFIQ